MDTGVDTEAGRPGEAWRGLVGGTQDKACGGARWDLSDELQIWVPRSRKCWRAEGSVEDKNTRQARQASWAGLGVRRGAWKLALALAVAAAVACEPLCHLPDCQAPT